MIKELMALGLTEIESKCYLFLNDNPNQTGYEVSKHIGVSRSNVYASLSALTHKGICRVQEGKSTTYSAVPIEDVLDRLKQEFKHSASILKRELQKKQKVNFGFYSSQGTDAVMAVIKTNISKAQSQIIADLWPEDLAMILPLLEEAQDRGVTVYLSTFEPVSTTLNNLIVDEDTRKEGEHSNFSILCDGQKVVVGSLDHRLQASAIETHHPAIVQLVQSAFDHDVIMTQLMHKHRDVLESDYPDGLQELVTQYLQKNR